VSTVANFRGCSKAVSDFFRTAGWVHASDSGRGNWATLAAVPAQDQYLFEIWKPGDSLTAFDVKIQYGNPCGIAHCEPVGGVASPMPNALVS
jgi:hypothetical protein